MNPRVVFLEEVDYLLGEGEVLTQAQTQQRSNELIHLHGSTSVFVDGNEDVFYEISLCLLCLDLVSLSVLLKPAEVLDLVDEATSWLALEELEGVLQVQESLVEEVGLDEVLLQLLLLLFGLLEVLLQAGVACLLSVLLSVLCELFGNPCLHSLSLP